MSIHFPVTADCTHPAASSLAPADFRASANLATPPASGRGDTCTNTPLPLVGGIEGGQERHTILTPRAKAAFLEHLAHSGNVRLACRAARVSPQTAYRARRVRPAFAALWDAALLSARDHAEQVLADRALNGVEEAVFYHGEEVARRTRYSDRLLLAHLARLDRLAERTEVTHALAQFDEAIAALVRGEELVGVFDPKPVRAGLVEAPCFSSNASPQGSTALRQAQGERPGEEAQGECDLIDQDRVPCVPSRRNCAGKHAGAADAPVPEPLPDFERRLQAMEAARPLDAPPIGDWSDPGAAEAMQLIAFEAGMDNWWLAGE